MNTTTIPAAGQFEAPLPLWQWIVRLIIISVEIMLAWWCSFGNELFFYQGF